MNKNNLKSILSKYYLSGMVESVKMSINNNNLDIKFISNNKELFGNLIHNNFDLIKGHNECDIAIYDTSQFSKMIDVLDDNIESFLIKRGKTFSKIILQSGKNKIEYALADLLVIPKPPNVNEPEYQFRCELNLDDINNIIKCRNALSTVEGLKLNFKKEQSISVEENDKMLFIFSEGSQHSHKISYVSNQELVCLDDSELDISVDANTFKEILNSNKNMEQCFVSISCQGLVKLEFTSNEMKTTYLLVAKNDF